MRWASVGILFLAALGGLHLFSGNEEVSRAMAAAADASEPMIAHNVYFTLNDDSPAAIDALVADCKKYLANHPGVVFFAAGTTSDFDRPVNDRDFHVGLHVVFANRAAHDQYQTAPDHLKFIEENRGNWKQVRVFDTDCLPLK